MLVFRGGNTSTLYESSVGLMGRKNASCFGVELQKRKPEKNANASLGGRVDFKSAKIRCSLFLFLKWLGWVPLRVQLLEISSEKKNG